MKFIGSLLLLKLMPSGYMENLTYEEFQTQHPEEYIRRIRNKLLYRYPGAGGESYIDVIERLRPLIIELERMEEDVIICTHNVVMRYIICELTHRTIVSYFIGLPLEQMTTLVVPLHTLYSLTPTPYGCVVKKYEYIADTDEFREMVE
jgi:6-phosphofructo-2-kinase